MNNKIYLTFDFDWASDEILLYALDIIEKFDINATFFVTNETKVLERFRSNPKIELGIHPNFNNILDGHSLEGGSKKIIDNFKKIVPESVSVRSHSLTQNSKILELFKESRFSHDCNLFIPYHSNIELKPFEHWNNIIRVPSFWVDDVFCLKNENSLEYWDAKRFLLFKGLKVFGFHPIHVYLNTENLDRYEKTREYHKEPEKLFNYRNNDNLGVNIFLENLIKEAKKMNLDFDNIKNIRI